MNEAAMLKLPGAIKAANPVSVWQVKRCELKLLEKVIDWTVEVPCCTAAVAVNVREKADSL